MASKKRWLALAIAMILVTQFLITSIPSIAANTLDIDMSNYNGEMTPKVGWLIVPNENIPDGRIIPLNTRIVRDDIETQNYLGAMQTDGM